MVPVGKPALWVLKTADKYGQQRFTSVGVGKVIANVSCERGSFFDLADCTANPICQGRLGCCTDNLDGSYTIEVLPTAASECTVAVYVDKQSLAEGYPHLSVKAFATDVCSSFNLTMNGARMNRVTDARRGIMDRNFIDSNQRIGVEYPSDAAALQVGVFLIPLKDSKHFNFSGELSIDLSKLPVGKYMLDMPATGPLLPCFLSYFELQCAHGYETLNGAGVCFEVADRNKNLLFGTVGAAVLGTLLIVMLILAHRHRDRMEALMKSFLEIEIRTAAELLVDVWDLYGAPCRIRSQLAATLAAPIRVQATRSRSRRCLGCGNKSGCRHSWCRGSFSSPWLQWPLPFLS